MKIVQQSVDILSFSPTALYLVESAGRVCYKSEEKQECISNCPKDHLCTLCEERSSKFISGLIKRGHESVLEHASISVKIVTDRGISHELVRHRIASYSQESTRFCNYSSNKFSNSITVILPPELTEEQIEIWRTAMLQSEKAYFSLIESNVPPQIARSVLPTCLKTEIVATMNIREWRHALRLRLLGTNGTPHPQIKEIMQLAVNAFRKLPGHSVFFEDIV